MLGIRCAKGEAADKLGDCLGRGVDGEAPFMCLPSAFPPALQKEIAGHGVAAGPVGRTATAQTDLQMHADILSWSRSQGLFAGVALEGATLRQDLDDNANLYGSKLENRAIVSRFGNIRMAPKPSTAASPFACWRVEPAGRRR